jgi:O-antigen ligase
VFSGVFISLCVILKGELYKGMAGRASYSLLTSKLLEVNYMATYISNTFVFSVYLLLRKHKIYYLAISLLVFVGLLLTGSRAAILGALLGIAVILYYFIGNKKKNKIFIFFLVIGFIVFFLIIASSFRARLFNFESYNDDSNRLRILHWIHALELIKKKPLLGYGPINTQIIFANELGMQGLSHNSYLGLLIQFGAFGFFIYLLIPFSMLLWGIKHKSGLLLGVIINICFTSLIIENQITMSFWIPMIILEMIINNINIRR